MLGYSGYTEHSDYYIAPHDTWESAFEFLKQLACESGDDEFCIGEMQDDLQDNGMFIKNVKWYKMLRRERPTNRYWRVSRPC